jgi:hypothetical protein
VKYARILKINSLIAEASTQLWLWRRKAARRRVSRFPGAIPLAKEPGAGFARNALQIFNGR